MTEPRMALLTRLEQAADSTEPDILREALRWAIEELMEADVTERLGAGPHVRTRERSGYRNGYRLRPFDSRLGALRQTGHSSGHIVVGHVPGSGLDMHEVRGSSPLPPTIAARSPAADPLRRPYVPTAAGWSMGRPSAAQRTIASQRAMSWRASEPGVRGSRRPVMAQ